METWRFNGNGTVSFDSELGTVTIDQRFLNNSYIGSDVQDITSDHPNYHAYGTTYRLGFSADDVDLQTVLDALATHPTPTTMTLRAGGGYGEPSVSFAGPGFVTHHWPTPNSVVNVTTDLHALDPGLVQREVVVIDGVYHIRTTGIGIGVFPAANIDYAADVWGLTDALIAQQLMNNTGINPTNPGHVDINGEVLDDQCFVGGTSIALHDATFKPIESVAIGDVVRSYDRYGSLQPGVVVRTFSKEVDCVLDFFGTGMTPGHVTLCGDGEFAGQHVPIMDILRSDGAVVKLDGSLVRAATGCEVGSDGDQFVTAILGDRREDGRFEVRSSGRIRLGTRIFDRNGTDASVLELIELNGGKVTPDGMIMRAGSAQPMPFVWTFSEALPSPEDYVLQRSGLTLRDVFETNEWEGAGPRLPHPDAPVQALSN